MKQTKAVMEKFDRNKNVAALLNALTSEMESKACRKVCLGALNEADKRGFKLYKSLRDRAIQATTMQIAK